MPKPRKKDTQKINARFLIYSEGETENYYFKSLIEENGYNKNNLVEIKPVDKTPNTPFELVEKAINDFEKEGIGENDIYWIVFDRDGHPKIPDAFNKVQRKKNFKIAFNSICFEIWIHLHFHYSARVFSSCDEIEHHIKKCHWNDYKKADKELYNKIKKNNRTDDARRRGKRMVLAAKSGNPGAQHDHQYNPYTKIHELLDDLEKFDKKNRKK